MNLYRRFVPFALGATLVASMVMPSAALAAGVTTMIQGGLDQAAGPNYKQSNTNLQSIVGGLISSALTLVGVLLLIYLIYAGFLWMTASDSKQVQTAKDIIKNAIIGLVIIFSAYAIANFVLAQLATIGGGTTPSGEQTKTQ